MRVRFRSEKAYSQTLLPKRQRPSLAWWVVAIVIAIIAIGYFGFRNDAKRLVTAPWPLGFENLVLAGCADTGSMDGTKELHLLENQGAIFYDKSIKDGSGKYHTIDGTWMFDETAKRYAVTLDGVVTAYSIVAPERTGICMLIKGKHDAADLAATALPGHSGS